MRTMLTAMATAAMVTAGKETETAMLETSAQGLFFSHVDRASCIGGSRIRAHVSKTYIYIYICVCCSRPWIKTYASCSFPRLCGTLFVIKTMPAVRFPDSVVLLLSSKPMPAVRFPDIYIYIYIWIHIWISSSCEGGTHACLYRKQRSPGNE